MEQNKLPPFDRMQVHTVYSLIYSLACCKQPPPPPFHPPKVKTLHVSPLPSCGSVFSFHTTLQLCSCPLPGECVYNSRLSPFARQRSSSSSVSLATLHGPDCILAEWSAGHAVPYHSFSPLVHRLP